ncbi:MAG: hypothetical protein ABEK36_00465 [Candidatus Aenigmatarchaeota archaeon]
MNKEENVLGVVKDLQTGFLGRNIYNLVLTDQRLIFAKYSTELMKQERERALEGAQDKGFFGRWKASLTSGFNFHNRYHSMEPDEIIREDEENFVINSEEIKSVKLRGRRFDPGSDKREPNKMEIVWSGGKEKFKFEKQTVNQVKEILKPVLGRKLN